MAGWVSDKSDNQILLKKNIWTVIARFDDVPDGPTFFHVQFYGTLPTIKPKNIETKWVRLHNPDDALDDDSTGHYNHVVGTQAGWEGKDTNLEFIGDGDLPMEFWVKTDVDWPVNSVVKKYFNTTAYIADRISVEA